MQAATAPVTQPAATVLDTPQQISVYQALVVKQGLKSLQRGMRLNRAYTPKNLMAMAAKITGKQFKARDYAGAAAAVEAWIAAERALQSAQAEAGQ